MCYLLMQLMFFYFFKSCCYVDACSCSLVSMYLLFFNTYRGWSVLVLRSSSTYLYSKEGVTQGDPLPMFIYAIGTLPLIRSLYDPGRWTQLWYADDASASGTLPGLRNWFDQLCSYGPTFGYYPEPTKSLLSSMKIEE